MIPVYHGLPEKPLAAEVALSIGVFDGVHLGHQALIARAKERARAEQRLCGVMTFDPHPVEVLAPGAAIKYLTDIDERLRLIEAAGADFALVMPFSKETARIPARDFVRPLFDALRMRSLVIGYDFTLGYQRQGNAAFLRALGAEWGFTVDVLDPITLDGEIVSSTRIRKVIAAGDIEKATVLLGHPPSVSGTLTPDLSLAIDPRRQIPSDGCYPSLFGVLGERMVGGEVCVAAGGITLPSIPAAQMLVGRIIRVEWSESAQPAWLPFEEVAHTADVALRVRGATLEDLLRHAADGMFNLIGDVSGDGEWRAHEIDVGGGDAESLLVNWLNELLFQAEMTGLIFRQFAIQLSGQSALHGVARGRPAAQVRKHIKAVTFHDMHIDARDGLLETVIVFDI